MKDKKQDSDGEGRKESADRSKTRRGTGSGTCTEEDRFHPLEAPLEKTEAATPPYPDNQSPAIGSVTASNSNPQEISTASIGFQQLACNPGNSRTNFNDRCIRERVNQTQDPPLPGSAAESMQSLDVPHLSRLTKQTLALLESGQYRQNASQNMVASQEIPEFSLNLGVSQSCREDQMYIPASGTDRSSASRHEPVLAKPRSKKGKGPRKQKNKKREAAGNQVQQSPVRTPSSGETSNLPVSSGRENEDLSRSFSLSNPSILHHFQSTSMQSYAIDMQPPFSANQHFQIRGGAMTRYLSQPAVELLQHPAQHQSMSSPIQPNAVGVQLQASADQRPMIRGAAASSCKLLQPMPKSSSQPTDECSRPSLLMSDNINILQANSALLKGNSQLTTLDIPELSVTSIDVDALLDQSVERQLPIASPDVHSTSQAVSPNLQNLLVDVHTQIEQSFENHLSTTAPKLSSTSPQAIPQYLSQSAAAFTNLGSQLEQDFVRPDLPRTPHAVSPSLPDTTGSSSGTYTLIEQDFGRLLSVDSLDLPITFTRAVSRPLPQSNSSTGLNTLIEQGIESLLSIVFPDKSTSLQAVSPHLPRSANVSTDLDKMIEKSFEGELPGSSPEKPITSKQLPQSVDASAELNTLIEEGFDTQLSVVSPDSSVTYPQAVSVSRDASVELDTLIEQGFERLLLINSPNSSSASLQAVSPQLTQSTDAPKEWDPLIGESFGTRLSVTSPDSSIDSSTDGPSEFDALIEEGFERTLSLASPDLSNTSSQAVALHLSESTDALGELDMLIEEGFDRPHSVASPALSIIYEQVVSAPLPKSTDASGESDTLVEEDFDRPPSVASPALSIIYEQVVSAPLPVSTDVICELDTLVEEQGFGRPLLVSSPIQSRASPQAVSPQLEQSPDAPEKWDTLIEAGFRTQLAVASPDYSIESPQAVSSHLPQSTDDQSEFAALIEQGFERTLTLASPGVYSTSSQAVSAQLPLSADAIAELNNLVEEVFGSQQANTATDLSGTISRCESASSIAQLLCGSYKTTSVKPKSNAYQSTGSQSSLVPTTPTTEPCAGHTQDATPPFPAYLVLFECAICKKLFKDYSDLQHHVNEHGEGAYKCPRCNANSHTLRDYLIHVEGCGAPVNKVRRGSDGSRQ